MYGPPDGYDYYEIPRVLTPDQRAERRERDAERVTELRREVVWALAEQYGADDTLDDAESDRRWERAERVAGAMDEDELAQVAL
ncbi:MAG: hypothetical protein ACR2RL_21630 [Gammaproteobacteria bacterium]